MSMAEGLFEKTNTNNLLKQFIKYSLVGGAAAVLDISIFYFLSAGLGLNYIFSNTMSFTIGVLANYLLSRGWVFGQHTHRFGRDFTLFLIIGVIGLFISNFILYILIDWGILYMLLAFAGDSFVKFTAKLIAVFIVLFWNFAARRKIVFHTAQGGN